MSDWYVVWCQTGAEHETLKKILACPGIQKALVPTQMLPYRQGGAWIMRDTVMIPSYVFARCQMDSRIYHTIKDMPRVLGWLGKDGYWPEVVPDDQMEPVLRLAGGAPPEDILQGVDIDRHKRRGRGTLTLAGTTQTITFCPTDYKQAEDTRVDERPADKTAEQTDT